MKLVLQICLSLILLFSYATAVYAQNDSTNIKLQIIIKEPIRLKRCNIGFDLNNTHLFNSSDNNCQFDSDKLLQQATQLVERKRLKNSMQIVNVTVTSQ